MEPEPVPYSVDQLDAMVAATSEALALMHQAALQQPMIPPDPTLSSLTPGYLAPFVPETHRPMQRCKQDLCTKKTQSDSGFCCRHRPCGVEGCLSLAKGSKGVCVRHGAGKRCREEGCEKLALGDKCRKHGGGKRCKHDQCQKFVEGKNEACPEHGGGAPNYRRKMCSVEGCEKVPIYFILFHSLLPFGAEKEECDVWCCGVAESLRVVGAVLSPRRWRAVSLRQRGWGQVRQTGAALGTLLAPRRRTALQVRRL
jgi:hypothetical protein